MSDRAQKLIQDLTEYIAATEGDNGADEAALIEATEKIAQILGDTGMKPGDVITLKSGVVYSAEPAFFNDGGDGEEVRVNGGQLFCRNWMALESVSQVISDAEAHQLQGGVPLPMTWDEEPRPVASVEERRAFLKELPELAGRLRTLALKRRDPELGKTARLAQKLAEVIETEVAGPAA